MIQYEPVIGLEVHAQLRTRSKMFCACPASYQQAAPNSLVCPVCLGLPGALPVINRQATEAVIMTGLALNSTIAEDSKFDRKNYPYPDLMKGYQISQFDLPLCTGGYLELGSGEQQRWVRIRRVHLEEDVAKLFHRSDPVSGVNYSLLDVNRSGVPLMELVSEPDLQSPEEARQYLVKLRSILRYLGVSTGNMEEGSFRCDANVSIRPIGTTDLLTRVEVKNMNSFRSVYRALQFEVSRQVQLAEDGIVLVQETRGWSEDREETFSMRSKEEAHDYRYFPEPDLPPIRVDRAWVAKIAAQLPELPDAKKTRFMNEYGLSEYDASMLTTTPALARYYEDACLEVRKLRLPGLMGDVPVTKVLANWSITELGRLLNATDLDVNRSPLGPRGMVDLLGLVQQGVIGTAQAKAVLEEMFATGKGAQAAVEDLGLTQLTDTNVLEAAIGQVIEEHPKAVDDFLKGKDTVVRFLVGQVMKATKGKASPIVISGLLRTQLDGKKD